MGYDYQKRLSSLKKQVDEGAQGRIGFVRAFVIAAGVFVLLLPVVRWLMPTAAPQSTSTEEQVRPPTTSDSLDNLATRLDLPAARRASVSGSASESVRAWERAQWQAEERARWLEQSTILGGAERYRRFAASVLGERPRDTSNSAKTELGGWFEIVRFAYRDGVLRGTFLVFAFWPWWLFSIVAGWAVARFWFRPKRTNDLLGVADPGRTPFYSGIWGVFRPNNSISGTDYACPGLACPEYAPKRVAYGHTAGKLLREYGALN
ncbi:MAG: hypothetical protein KDD44_12160, partial [Bdellovibrionales bacterium]|nr:hypothetical protein [Bdellovibrionales bacterium]